jgi:hypothetical protein
MQARIRVIWDLAVDVDKFRDEFVRFLELSVFAPMTLGHLPAAVGHAEGGRNRRGVQRSQGTGLSSGQAESRTRPGPAQMRIAVAGTGEFGVIDAWLTVAQPKPGFYPDDVLAVCNNVIGRLEGMIKRAEAEEPFQVDVEAVNPLIWAPPESYGTSSIIGKQCSPPQGRSCIT